MVKSGNRDLLIWISFLITMVIMMVVIGGITRVTGSGLSMVEWRPLVGWLPPLDDEEWQRVFNLYKRSPEFISLNSWMDLSAFKEIFWWEYVHRLWGRLIGLAFLCPLGVFFNFSENSKTVGSKNYISNHPWMHAGVYWLVDGEKRIVWRTFSKPI